MLLVQSRNGSERNKKGDDLDLWDHRLSMGGGGWDVNFFFSIKMQQVLCQKEKEWVEFHNFLQLNGIIKLKGFCFFYRLAINVIFL
jgi:hypothetical protein